MEPNQRQPSIDHKFACNEKEVFVGNFEETQRGGGVSPKTYTILTVNFYGELTSQSPIGKKTLAKGNEGRGHKNSGRSKAYFVISARL